MRDEKDERIMRDEEMNVVETPKDRKTLSPATAPKNVVARIGTATLRPGAVTLIPDPSV